MTGILRDIDSLKIRTKVEFFIPDDHGIKAMRNHHKKSDLTFGNRTSNPVSQYDLRELTIEKGVPLIYRAYIELTYNNCMNATFNFPTEFNIVGGYK